MLAGAEELTGAAELQVHLGDGEAVGGVDHGVQAGAGGFGFGVAHQQAIGDFGAATDPAAQLVQLAEADARRRR